MASLYIIATPIGNLADITHRALEILAQVDFIAAEDTRTTARLLAEYNISTEVLSYHSHNAQYRDPQLIQYLLNGKNVGLVSDAGTPLISDPGFSLVRHAIEAHITVIPIPGPSSLIAALSASGLRTDGFVFEGFLPHKSAARAARLRALQYESRTLVFYESKHRLLALLEEAQQIFGADRPMVLAKELTKCFERFLRGPIETIIAQLRDDEILQKGEFVVIIEGSRQQDQADIVRAHTLFSCVTSQLSHKDAVTLATRLFDLNKNQLYAIAREYYQDS